MNKLVFKFVATALFFTTSLSQAEELKGEMSEAYEALGRLQKFTASPSSFENPANRAQIISLLEVLSKTFHRLDELDSRYSNEAGFKETLKLTEDTIDDALVRLKEGRATYSLWRLRGLETHCATCHLSHNVSLAYRDAVSGPGKDLSPYQRGRLYFAGRRYDEASSAFLVALKQKDLDSFKKMEVLRNWLLIETRLERDPSKAVLTLQKILPALNLPAYEEMEVANWILSLERWRNEGTSAVTLKEAERLLAEAVSQGPRPDTRFDTVSALRATSVLNELVASPELNGETKARAFFLLGWTYSRLPLFFIDELPEIYLALSIDEAPGSDVAKTAFLTYREHVLTRFTGSGGVSDIPIETRKQLDRLYEKAHFKGA